MHSTLSIVKSLKNSWKMGGKSKGVQDEIELLNLLIEKYDTENNSFEDADPVQLLKALMKDHKMKAVDLAGL